VALAIDASSPAATTVSGVSTTPISTASFNPPAGSYLVVAFSANTASGVTPGTPTITDNLGTPLTYNLRQWKTRATAPTANGQVAIWTAPVVSGGAMIVSVTTGTASGNQQTALKVWVVTGQDSVTPVGTNGKNASTSASSISQSYTGAGTGGWGFLVTCDWSALGSFTAGTGCTVDATGTVPTTQFSYAFARRTVADDTNGGSNSLNVNAAGSSTDLSWAWLEMLPPSSSGTAPQAQVIPASAGTTRISPIVVAPTIGPPQVIRLAPITALQFPRVLPAPFPTAVTPPLLPAFAAPILVVRQAQPLRRATVTVSSAQIAGTPPLPLAVTVAVEQFRPAVVPPIVLTPPILAPPAQPAAVLVAAQQFRPQSAPPVVVNPALPGLPVPSAPFWINPSRSQPPLAAVTSITPPSLPQAPAPITVASARPQALLAAVITLVPAALPQAAAPVVVVTSTWRPRQPQISLCRPALSAATAGILSAPIVVAPTFAVRSAVRPLTLVGVTAPPGPDIDITVGRPRTPWTAELAPTWTATTVRSHWDTDLEQTWTVGGLQ